MAGHWVYSSHTNFTTSSKHTRMEIVTLIIATILLVPVGMVSILFALLRFYDLKKAKALWNNGINKATGNPWKFSTSFLENHRTGKFYFHEFEDGDHRLTLDCYQVDLLKLKL
jgi:hypothetical protein